MGQLHPGKFSKVSSDWLAVLVPRQSGEVNGVLAPRQSGEVNGSVWKTYLDPPRLSGPFSVIADYISLFTSKRLQPTPTMLVVCPCLTETPVWLLIGVVIVEGQSEVDFSYELVKT